jgi:hypothetical protein
LKFLSLALIPTKEVGMNAKRPFNSWLPWRPDGSAKPGISCLLKQASEIPSNQPEGPTDWLALFLMEEADSNLYFLYMSRRQENVFFGKKMKNLNRPKNHQFIQAKRVSLVTSLSHLMLQK